MHLVLLLLVLLTSPYAQSKVDYDKLEEEDEARALTYLGSHPSESQQIVAAFEKMSHVKLGLVKINETARPPVLIVHGIEKKDFYSEWVEPMGQLFDKDLSLSLFTWHERKSIEDTQEILARAMKELLQEHPGQDLTVLAHSAGGIVAILALDTLSKTEDTKRVHLHSIAAPLYGYGAPLMAYMGAPFVGRGPIEVGRGFAKEIRDMHLKSCHQWITVSCEFDKHACLTHGQYPQTGPVEPPGNVPCGKDNLTRLTGVTHAASIKRVVEKVFP